MISREQLEKFKSSLSLGTTKSKVTKIALVAIAAGLIPVVVVGAAAMGNAVQVFKMFDKRKVYKNKQIADAIRSLHQSKYIEYISDAHGITTIRITRNGETKLKSFSIDILDIKKQKKWDKKWRVVMFDLPIDYKKVRNSFRFKLKQIGFVQLQKSVWIYPYPCIDELLFLVDYYKLSKYVEILTIEKMVDDKKLRSIFNLK